MLRFAGDGAPPNSQQLERLLIDDAFDAYLEWRDESAEVWHAYKRWNGAPARDARRKFWAYRAALEREEHAARVYGRLLSRLNLRVADLQACYEERSAKGAEFVTPPIDARD